jgi:hypothetical protein
MKKLLTPLAFCCLMFATNLLMAQTPDKDAEMKAWMAYMTPGNEHQQMAKTVGEWKATTKMWMDPSQPPTVSDSKVKFEMMYGGRYLTGHYSGDMMGMPFEGTSTIAYDNAAKRYVTTWLDNMGTGIMYAEGKWRDDIKGIEFKGMSVDPITGKDIKTRQVITFKDPNTQMFEMFMDMGGKEVKSMEMTLTRM